MTLIDAIKREITVRHTCRRCNRPLTDKESIQRGIGPICLKKEQKARPYHYYDYKLKLGWQPTLDGKLVD